MTAMGTNKFVYDGWLPVREQAATGGNATSNYYVWGLDLSQSMQGAGGIGGLLMATLDGKPYFSAFDANGNVTEYTDTNGTVVAHYAYDPFGNISAQSGAMAADFSYRFSTKYTDDETGLVYYGFRYYSPELGRWLNRDPIQERAQINLYSFGPNSPVNGFDVLGRAWGNARAVRHFYTGGGRNVTLDEIGHRSTVTAAATPQMDAYEQIARDAALNSAGNLSCNGSSGVVSDHIQHSDSVGVNSGVFWIGGFSLARQYDCSIELNCSTCAGTYTCTLWFFMNDEFVDPLDFDNSGDDPWDDWQLGGTPFSVLGDWERNIDGTF